MKTKQKIKIKCFIKITRLIKEVIIVDFDILTLSRKIKA